MKKKFLLIIPAIILIVSLYFLSGNLQKTKITLSPTPSPAVKKIDLASGRLTEVKDPQTGRYVEQKGEVCDFKNLSKTFSVFLMPGKSGEPVENEKRKSAYGEKTWWFGIQGEVIEVKEVNGGIKYLLSKDNETLEVLATEQTKILMEEIIFPDSKTNSSTDSASKTLKKINIALLGAKEKAIFYLTLKCGGDKNPLLLVDVVQKISSFVEKDKLSQ